MREFQVTVHNGRVHISPLSEDGMPSVRSCITPDQVDEFVILIREAQEEARVQEAMEKEIAAVRKKYNR